MIYCSKLAGESVLFNIETENLSYVFVNRGYLQSLYYGAKIHGGDLEQLMSRRSHSSFDNDVDLEREEFGFWDSKSFVEPCLKIAYADTRKLNVSMIVYKIEDFGERERLTITMKNSFTDLYVDLVYDVYAQYDIIARHAVVRNEGAEVVIENLKSAAAVLPEIDDCRIRYLTGKWAGESQITDTYLQTGAFTMQSKRGNTGPHFNPSYAIDDGTANEQRGDVWFGLLGYSGNWQITVEKTIYNNIRVTGGISSFDFMYALKKGESITTPVMYFGFTNQGYGGMSRTLHTFQREFIFPKKSLNRVLYNSWEATLFDVNEEDQKNLAKHASEMGVELFVIDDGWFGERHNDKAGLGDWYVNAEKFPSGLQPFIDYVESLGMDFGIWVEPEAVNPDSALYRAHPDWIYRFKDQEPVQGRNQYVLNISKPEVKAYIIEFMTKLLGENKGITFIKWDMNRTLNDVSAGDTAKDKELWYRHAESLYDIWDTLRKKFPEVEFETCSGGGGRIDLGILRYADQSWASDNTDAFDRLFIQEGFSYFYAPKVMMCWVTDSSSGGGKKYVRPYSYRFHSSMMGGLGIGADISKFDSAAKEEFKGYIEEYKSIRETILTGNLYRLRSPRECSVCAAEYVSQNGCDIVLFLFLHGKITDKLQKIKLQGLEADALYSVAGFSEPLHGSTLMNVGLPVGLRGDFDSRMVRITRVRND